MTNNFFKLLSKLDSEFLQKYSPLSTSGKQTIQRLIMYVESGNWSKSEITKLYCRNWNKSYDQLRLIFREEGFKDRSEVTIRSQVSELSRNLCEMFGACDEIYNAFRAASGRGIGDMTKAQGDKYITKLNLKLQVLEGYRDEPFLRKLAVNPHHFGVNSFPERLYQVSDCENEIALLKTLSEESVQALCSSVDSDKMAFLLQVLNRPLLITERSEKHRQKDCESTYKVNRLSVNTAKIDILQALDLAVPKKIKPKGFENTQVNKESSSVNVTTGTEDDFTSALIEVKSGLPFRFAVMSELCEVLQEKLAETMKITHTSEEMTANIRYLSNLLRMFTVEGLTDYLKKFEGVEVEAAVKPFRKDLYGC